MNFDFKIKNRKKKVEILKGLDLNNVSWKIELFMELIREAFVLNFCFEVNY